MQDPIGFTNHAKRICGTKEKNGAIDFWRHQINIFFLNFQVKFLNLKALALLRRLNKYFKRPVTM